MAACTFFGHRDCPDTVKPKLRSVLEALVKEANVDTFYVGNQGAFDAIARGVLRELAKEYPHIRYAVVLAYMPGSKGEYDYSDTMLPEGMELVHPKRAISWRNDWMLRQSDFVVAYVTHSWGGAASFVEKATKKGRKLINISKIDGSLLIANI